MGKAAVAVGEVFVDRYHAGTERTVIVRKVDGTHAVCEVRRNGQRPIGARGTARIAVEYLTSRKFRYAGRELTHAPRTAHERGRA